MAVPGAVVFTLERNSPGLYCPYSSETPRGSLSEKRESEEVVLAVDSDASSVECGVEAECVGHHHRRGVFSEHGAKLSDFTNRAEAR